MTAHSPGRVHWRMLFKRIEQQAAKAGKCTVLETKAWFVTEGMSRAARSACWKEVDKALDSLEKSGRIQIVLGSHRGNPTRTLLVTKSEKKTTRKADTGVESDKGSFGIPGI